VRPDYFVAWRAQESGGETKRLMDVMRGVLGFAEKDMGNGESNGKTLLASSDAVSGWVREIRLMVVLMIHFEEVWYSKWIYEDFYSVALTHWLYADLDRMLGPYLKNIHGMGTMTRQTKASSIVAHLTPSASYIWTVNNGKAAPIVYLSRPLAAIADAPLSGPYTSSMYSAAEMKTVTLPNANGMPARTGTIQWKEVLAVSANQISLQNKLDVWFWENRRRLTQ
jgi:hypothetical protein